jgi:hypothetical protein
MYSNLYKRALISSDSFLSVTMSSVYLSPKGKNTLVTFAELDFLDGYELGPPESYKSGEEIKNNNGFMIFRGLMHKNRNEKTTEISSMASKYWKDSDSETKQFFTDYAKEVLHRKKPYSVFRQFDYEKHKRKSIRRSMKKNKSSKILQIAQEVITGERCKQIVNDFETVSTEGHQSVDEYVNRFRY